MSNQRTVLTGGPRRIFEARPYTQSYKRPNYRSTQLTLLVASRSLTVTRGIPQPFFTTHYRFA